MSKHKQLLLLGIPIMSIVLLIPFLLFLFLISSPLSANLTCYQNVPNSHFSVISVMPSFSDLTCQYENTGQYSVNNTLVTNCFKRFNVTTTYPITLYSSNYTNVQCPG